jgi:O-antigen ligase
VARSGSRMALVLFVAGFIIFLIGASQKERVGVVAATIALMAITIPVLPQSVLERFTTFFSSRQAIYTYGDARSEALESSQARIDLLVRSLELTAMHPLFGVGPCQFSTADDQDAKAQGERRGMWRYTHNAYTQLSSESGIIGALLYILVLIAAYRGISPIRKNGSSAMVRTMAKYVQISLWMVILGGFFLTIGFGGIPFAVLGLCVAFQLAARDSMPAAQAVAVASS